jgi:hypothetical protein
MIDIRKPLAIVLLAALALAGQTSPSPEGDALFLKQDWAGAAQEFQKAIDRDPTNGYAWFRLASTLHRLGRNEEARHAFLHAIEFQFQAPQAMSAVARSYAHDNDAAKTVEWLGKAAAAGFAGVQFVNGDPDFAKVKSATGFAEAVAKIDRNAHPCLTRPENRQLDFWLGEWDVQVSGQTVGSSRIESVLDGCILQENWMPQGSPGGKSWNFYNAATRKWEQVWMGGGSVLKFEGGFTDGAMRYEGATPQAGGSSILERLTFTPVAPNRVHQLWLRSTDGGKTWTTAFDGIYVPKKKSS